MIPLWQELAGVVAPFMFAALIVFAVNVRDDYREWIEDIKCDAKRDRGIR